MSYKRVRNFLDMLMYLNFDMKMLEEMIGLPEPQVHDIANYPVEGAEY